MAWKIFAVVLFACFSEFSMAEHAEFREASLKCASDGGISEAQIENFFKKRPVETEDEKIRCFFKCLMMDTKWMNEDGTINEKPTMGVPHEFSPFVHVCRNVTGKDLCEKAFNFHKCVVEKKEGMK